MAWNVRKWLSSLGKQKRPRPVPMATVVIRVVDEQGRPIVGALVQMLNGESRVAADGLAQIDVPESTVRAAMSVSAVGYDSLDLMADLQANFVEVQLEATRRPVVRRTGAAMDLVKAAFGGLYDSDGTILYTPATSGAMATGRFDDWARVQTAHGCTHWLTGPYEGGVIYPGYAFECPNLLADPPALRAHFERILDTPAADGIGYGLIVMLDSGGPDPLPRIRQSWPIIRRALEGLKASVLLCPGYEVVVGDWHSWELDEAMKLGNELFPVEEGWVWGFHGSPGNGVGSRGGDRSRDPWRKWTWPVRSGAGFLTSKGEYTDDPNKADYIYGPGIGTSAEADKRDHPDPLGKWEGAENEFYLVGTGRMFTHLFFQLDRNDALLNLCDFRDETPGRCPYNRLKDFVERPGLGARGWRKMHVSAIETIVWYQFHEPERFKSMPGLARRVAAHCQAIGDAFGVPIGHGNGLP